jgi:hypothetical protein
MLVRQASQSAEAMKTNAIFQAIDIEVLENILVEANQRAVPLAALSKH